MLIPYRSVRTPCRKETEIKKSIFIAQLFPVETEEEAQSILETVRKNHKDAATTAGHGASAPSASVRNQATAESRRGRQDIPCSISCR